MFSIVIPNYNGKEFLEQCLASILGSRFQVLGSSKIGSGYQVTGISKSKIKNQKPETNNLVTEIIIVDNNSSDGSVEFIKSLTSSRVNELKKKKPNSLINNSLIKLIKNKKNLGFAAGNNIGIRYVLDSGADYIVVLNNDVIVKNDFLTPLVSFLEENKEVGVVTPKIYFAPGHEFHKDRYKKNEQGKVIWSVGGTIDWQNVIASNRGVDEVDKGQYDQETEVDFASGCCLMAPSFIWEKVNFFDERYFLYYEDSDLCQRVKRAGYKIVYVPGSKIWHLNAGSSQVGGNLHDYFIARNRLLFGIRWAPWRAKFALLRESLKLLKSGRKWQKIGARDFYLRRFGKGSWGN